MPYVNVKITRSGVTRDHKHRIVSEITDTLVRVLGKRADQIHIVLDLVDEDDWGYDGMLTTDYLAAKRAAAE